MGKGNTCKFLALLSNPSKLTPLQPRQEQRYPLGTIFCCSHISKKNPQRLSDEKTFGDNRLTKLVFGIQGSSSYDIPEYPTYQHTLQQPRLHSPTWHSSNACNTLCKGPTAPIGYGLISHPGTLFFCKAPDNPFQHSHWHLEPIDGEDRIFSQPNHLDIQEFECEQSTCCVLWSKDYPLPMGKAKAREECTPCSQPLGDMLLCFQTWTVPQFIPSQWLRHLTDPPTKFSNRASLKKKINK